MISSEDLQLGGLVMEMLDSPIHYMAWNCDIFPSCSPISMNGPLNQILVTKLWYAASVYHKGTVKFTMLININ